MTKLYFILLLVFGYTVAFSQNAGSIRGTIIEKKGPVEFANIVVYSAKDSLKVVKIFSTDSTGQFYFEGLIPNNYLLKIKMIGYLPLRLAFQIDSTNKNIDLQKLELKTDGKLLSAVEITTHKDLIKKTPQGFIINAADNLTQSGGTATDLLKNTPTVVVDADGGITLRGKSPLILINGRNSSIGSTDKIPASSIESIEIINNPSAQYDADAEGGIINIKLKKNSGKGTNGSAVIGAGYGAKGRVNSSFNINHHTSKWNVGLTYDNRYADRTRHLESNRTNFDLPNQYYLIQKRNDDRLELTHNLKLNLDFSPNKKNSFGLEVLGNIDGQNNDESLNTLINTQTDSFASKNLRRSIEIGREKVAEIALNYDRKFNDPRKYLKVNLSSSFNQDNEKTDITTQSLSENNSDIGSAYLQRTYNYQNSNVSNLKLDFAQPISKRGTLETGYKGISRYTNADFQSQYFVNNTYVANPLTSNIFNFQEQVHAAYLQYRGFTGNEDSAKWRYDIGIRGEEVLNHGKGVNNNIDVRRQYFNYFPSANLAYYLNSNDFLKLSIGRRINRPGLGALNPFVDITDSLNPHSGNPYLKPELINSAEIGYNKEMKKISFSASLFYRYATNIIRQYVFLDNNGVALSKPMNFGNATTYGLEAIASVFPAKFWSMNVSASCYQQNIDGTNINPEISNNVFSWYGKLINNFTLWKGGKLQVIANYNSPIGSPQGQKIAIYFADFGFQQQLFKGKARLGLVLTDAFNTQRNGYTSKASNFSNYRYSKLDTRAILMTFAYSFGTSFKEDLMENKYSNE